MDFITKRQKFANEQRRRHRQQIFKKHRNMELKHIEQSRQIQNNIISGQQNNKLIITSQEYPLHYSKINRKFQFNFKNQFLAIDFINTDDIENNVKNGHIQRMLQTMPKWIASLPFLRNKDNQFFSQSKQLLQRLIILSKYCVKSNRLIQPITNCLVELTGLPTQSLTQLGIQQGLLCKQFMFQVFRILKQTSDMQIIFNCVYICGNLHQKFIQIGTKMNMAKHIQQIQITIITKMEDICSKYPNYENCLQIMLWYIKNCLVINKNQEQKQKNFQNKALFNYQNIQQDNHNLQIYSVNIIHRSIVSLCSQIVKQDNKSPQVYQKKLFMTKQTEKYYLSMIKTSLKILYILLSDSTLFYKTENKNKLSANKNLQKILLQIDQIFSILLSSSALFNHHQNSQIIEGVSQIMSQILFYLTSVPNYLSMIPPSILNLCEMTTQGLIQSGQAFQVCRNVFDICIQHNVMKIQRMMVKNFLNNCKRIVVNECIVSNREFRIKVIELFVDFQDHITHEQIKDIITKEIVSHPFENQNINSGQSTYKSNQNKLIQKKYQIYMLQNIIPFVLNVLELIIIDSDSENRMMGLRSILKFTTNWQISTEVMRNIVASMGISRIIIQMQSDKEQGVYNAALDLIQQLRLDETEGWQVMNGIE